MLFTSVGSEALARAKKERRGALSDPSPSPQPLATDPLHRACARGDAAAAAQLIKGGADVHAVNSVRRSAAAEPCGWRRAGWMGPRQGRRRRAGLIYGSAALDAVPRASSLAERVDAFAHRGLGGPREVREDFGGGWR